MSIDLNPTDYVQMIKHYLNVILVLGQQLPESSLRADWIADLLDCRTALPLLLNPPQDEEEEEELQGEEVISASCPPKPADPVPPRPVKEPQVSSQKEAGPVKIDGFIIPATIPDDKRLNMLGLPVLQAYCKRWDLTVYTEKAALVAVLSRARRGMLQFGDHAADRAAKAASIPTATVGKPAVVPAPASTLKPITLRGFGKGAIEGMMTRSWTVPLMVEFCRMHNFILPPTVVDFVKALNKEARLHGWNQEEEAKVSVVETPEFKEARAARPQPAPALPIPPKPAPAPAPITATDVRAQVTALLTKPTLGNLSKACDLVPSLKRVDRKDTGNMRTALRAWLEGGPTPPSAAPAPAGTKPAPKKVTDDPLTPRPTQVRILKALAKHGTLSKKQIAQLSPCNESDVTYWVGSFDQAVMDKGEAYRGMKCLIRLGMVVARMDLRVNEKTGETAEIMVHEITEQGLTWLAANPSA